MNRDLYVGLRLVAEDCRDADRPVTEAEARELLAAVHHTGEALDALHDDIAGCFGPLDGSGRCTDCGRLVVHLHKERGCLMLVPLVGQVLWLIDNAYSVPLVGKALWLASRRRKGDR